MPLEAGTRLGPYEVVSQLGVGGMGEVYRAQDVRLGRDVALKVVAAHVGISPEVRQRFEREARAIAGLSHPNICALFDVGNHDGSDYLVMELLEGESLADRLARGPLPLDLVLRWGAQILSALARAHRGSIVHRDLKPANIMITPSGVKLLDFGLAQLRSEISAPAGPAGSSGPGPLGSVSLGPTRVAPLTGDGMILGTLQYMAPEQLEGRPVDVRSDLFAFGALLYEMVTGSMAFPGSSMASVISSILRDQPQPLTERNPLAPQRLERLIGRCLAKDPEERWQSAHDLRIQLEELAAAEGSGDIDRASSAHEGTPVRPARLSVLAAALLVAALAGASVAWWWTAAPAADQPTIRFAVPPPEGMVFPNNRETVHFAVSPDGRQVAFVASGVTSGGPPEAPSIWLRSLANEAPRQLAGSEGASGIFWSPTGDEIAFFAAGRLKRMAVAGGTPVVICEVSQGSGLAGTWGRNAIVFSNVQGEALYRVDLAGGEPERLHDADPARDEFRVHWPWFLPDGLGLLYLSTDGTGSAHLNQIPAGGEPRQVAPFSSRVETMDPDLLVFAEDGALFAQHFDAETGRLVAAPIPLAPEVNSFDATKFAAFAASPGGTVVLANGQNDGYLAWFDEAGRELGRVGERGERMTVNLSADGRQAIADRYQLAGASFDISLIDLERNIESSLVSTPMTEAFPIWMPGDRSFVYAAAVRGRPPQLFRRDLESSVEEQLLDDPSFQIPISVLRDGRILLRRRPDQSGFGLYIMQPGGVTSTQPLEELLPGTRSVQAARLSKDEKWAAYLAAESGRWEAYVKPLDALGAAVRVSSAGANGLDWSADGSQLLFTAPDSHLYAAKIETVPSLRVGQAEERFALPALGWSSFAVAADGRILAIVESAHANAQPLTVVVNGSVASRAGSEP